MPMPWTCTGSAGGPGGRAREAGGSSTPIRDQSRRSGFPARQSDPAKRKPDLPDSRTGPCQLDQDEDGDGIEDHQPRGIDQGADQGGGDDGRVDPEPPGQEGDQRPHPVGPDADADDRQGDDGGEGLRMAEQEPGEDRSEDAQQGAQEQAGQDLAEQDTGRVAALDLAQGQPADDRADSLAAGVAAGADQQGDEGVELDLGEAGIDPVEAVDDVARDGPADEQQEQPADAAADGLDDPPLPVGLLVGLDVARHAAEGQDVLGLLLAEDVHGVVVGDDPNQHIRGIHDGDGDQVVLVDLAGDAFLVLVDPGEDDVALHDRLDHGRAAREDQPLERDKPDQPPLMIDHVTVIDRLAVGGLVAEPVEGLADGDVRRQRDIIGGHDGAGGA